MTLYVYTARWFSTLDWGWLNHDIVAESEAQVRAYVDAHTAKQYRAHYGVADSLEIGPPVQIKLPFGLGDGWSKP